MVSPLEVMKGSILSFEGKSQIVKGVAEYIMFEGRKEWIGGSLISGEPITEQWLLKLGFESDQFTYSKGKVWLAPNNKGFDIFTNGLSAGITRHVEYLHELQVLFFAVTREHLIIPKLK